MRSGEVRGTGAAGLLQRLLGAVRALLGGARRVAREGELRGELLSLPVELLDLQRLPRLGEGER